MRNLQKILALVMAMVMSFSLLATVNAADFPDAGEINDTYSDAVTVLSGLEVFQGYKEDGTFRPKGNITRAEVAAIIYRIVTGDVKDTQKDIYSSWGKFNDVSDGSWYAGYVNYCANAGYIKGYNNTTFGPNDQVTGYQALAMILRAVGYDKNGEFTGSQWQIRTASIARERGVTKNVTDTLLGQAATRETVAELLFRSIIIPKVDFNANTLSYTLRGDKETLGYESLKLEEVTGIVTANEYADLENTKALNSGKTRMVVEVDKKATNYTLDYSEENLLDGLDAIGEEHNAYIQNANTTSAKVLVMAKTDKNKTYETLEKKDIDSDSDFRSVTGLQRGNDTETKQFINFGEDSSGWKSDWRIKYVVSMDVSTPYNYTQTVDAVRRAVGRGFDLPELTETAFNRITSSTRDVVDGYSWDKNTLVYTQEFKINDDIGARGRTNIETIFNIADRYDTTDYVRGEVYAGTTSLKDVSDIMSLKQFKDEYINTDKVTKITGNEYGNWLKVIDNDNDGQADYVLKVVYTMAQVVRAKDSKYGLDVEDKNLCKSREAVNYLEEDNVKSEDSLVLDDIVYYAVIDGTPWATKAEMVTAKIDVVNRKDLKVTTTDGTEYLESGVCGKDVVSKDYNSEVVNMNGSATYDIYLDRGGYLALFKDSNNDFTLIVDGWYNEMKSGTEYAVRAYNDETGRQDVVDINRGGDLFIDGHVEWDRYYDVQNNDWHALKWLGGTTESNDRGALDNSINVYDKTVRIGDDNAAKLNGGTPKDDKYTTAAVTNYVKTTVATLAGDVIQPVDYSTIGGSKIVRMLAPANNEIPKAAASYHAKVYSTSGTDTAYNVLSGEDAEVRALSSTVYYLVYPAIGAESGFAVERYVGYSNVPSIAEGYIEDVYAVGTKQDRTSSLGQSSYYTANVVVVELNNTYKGNQEQVFIYDMPVVSSSVTIEEVGLIHENGKKEDGVKIDFGKSRIRDYQVAMNVSDGWRNWGPGLYYMYPSNTEGVYTVQPMYAEDIAATDYVVGWSNTSYATVGADYISVLAFDGNVTNRYSNSISTAYDVVEKSVNRNDCTIYTLGYNNRGVADLGVYEATEGNIRQYLSEQADVNKGNDYAPYDHSDWSVAGTYRSEDWNQNRVLVHYKDGNAKYAISFSNKTVDGAYARKVWTSSLPGSANTTWAKAGGAIRMAETLVKVWEYRGGSQYNNAWFIDSSYGYEIDRFIVTLERAMRGLNEAALKDKTIYNRAEELYNQLHGYLFTLDETHDPMWWIEDSGTPDVDTRNYVAAKKIWDDNNQDLSDLTTEELEDLQALVTAAREERLTKAEQDELDKIQAAIDDFNKQGEKATVKVDVLNAPGCNAALADGDDEVKVDAGDDVTFTVTINNMDGLKVDDVSADGAVVTFDATTTNGVCEVKITLDTVAADATVEVTISVVEDDGGDDETDETVKAGDALDLSAYKDGDEISITVTDAKNKDDWNAVVGGNVPNLSAAKADADGKVKFTYTVTQADIDNKDGVVFELTPLTALGGGNGSILAADDSGRMKRYTILPAPQSTEDNTGSLAGMGRSAADPEFTPDEKGTLFTIDYFDPDDPDKVIVSILCIWDIREGDEEPEMYIVDMNQVRDNKDKIDNAAKDEETGLPAIDTPDDPCAVKGMDGGEKSDGSDATNIVVEGGEVKKIVLGLGQPKAKGAKLPTTMVLTENGKEEGEGEELTVNIQWFYNGEPVDLVDGKCFAEDTKGYTYKVTLDPKENTGVTLAPTVAVEKTVVADDGTESVVENPSVDTTKGLTVPANTSKPEDIVSDILYTLSVKADTGLTATMIPEGGLYKEDTAVIITVTGVPEGAELVATDDQGNNITIGADNKITVTVKSNMIVTVSVKGASIEAPVVTVEKDATAANVNVDQTSVTADADGKATITGTVTVADLGDNKIVVKNAAGETIATATVAADGKWTANLTGITADVTVTIVVSKDEVPVEGEVKVTLKQTSNKNSDALTLDKETINKNADSTLTFVSSDKDYGVPADITSVETWNASGSSKFTLTKDSEWSYKDGVLTIKKNSEINDEIIITATAADTSPVKVVVSNMPATDKVSVTYGEIRKGDALNGITITLSSEDSAYTIVKPTITMVGADAPAFSWAPNGGKSGVITLTGTETSTVTGDITLASAVTVANAVTIVATVNGKTVENVGQIVDGAALNTLKIPYTPASGDTVGNITGAKIEKVKIGSAKVTVVTAADGAKLVTYDETEKAFVFTGADSSYKVAGVEGDSGKTLTVTITVEQKLSEIKFKVTEGSSVDGLEGTINVDSYDFLIVKDEPTGIRTWIDAGELVDRTTMTSRYGTLDAFSKSEVAKSGGKWLIAAEVTKGKITAVGYAQIPETATEMYTISVPNWENENLKKVEIQEYANGYDLKDVTVTLEAASGYDALPAKTEVSVDAPSGVTWDYNENTGVITFKGTLTADITITTEGAKKNLAELNVSVDGFGVITADNPGSGTTLRYVLADSEPVGNYLAWWSTEDTIDDLTLDELKNHLDVSATWESEGSDLVPNKVAAKDVWVVAVEVTKRGTIEKIGYCKVEKGSVYIKPILANRTNTYNEKTDPLQDGSFDASVTGVNEITIKVSGTISRHPNGNKDMGWWIGIGVPYDKDAKWQKAWNDPADDKVALRRPVAYQKAPTEDKVTGASGDTVAEGNVSSVTDETNHGTGTVFGTFYFDLGEMIGKNNKSKGYVVKTTGTGDDAKSITYIIDFSRVKINVDADIIYGNPSNEGDVTFTAGGANAEVAGKTVAGAKWTSKNVCEVTIKDVTVRSHETSVETAKGFWVGIGIPVEEFLGKKMVVADTTATEEASRQIQVKRTRVNRSTVANNIAPGYMPEPEEATALVSEVIKTDGYYTYYFDVNPVVNSSYTGYKPTPSGEIVAAGKLVSDPRTATVEIQLKEGSEWVTVTTIKIIYENITLKPAEGGQGGGGGQSAAPEADTLRDEIPVLDEAVDTVDTVDTENTENTVDTENTVSSEDTTTPVAGEPIYGEESVALDEN